MYIQRSLCAAVCRGPYQHRAFSTARVLLNDPKLGDLGRVIEGEYAIIRENYEKPKNPLILAHGLLGFNELRLVPNLPGVQYWRGITEALREKDIEVIIATVPPSGSIEARAEKLSEIIAQKAAGKSVNIIAGLDSRYMLSQLKPTNVNALSLTTIATPHRGSAFADYTFDLIGTTRLPRVFKAMEWFGFEHAAFPQLTRKYMQENFNPKTPDRGGVRYYSYGATLEPTLFSIFRPSHAIIKRMEGSPNDGLVSVASSQWGEYKGTLVGVSHLDLINWSNRMKWFFYSITGQGRKFNAIAFYLDIADMLAKEGL
ncbi:alpha/beta-hydrolase [Patellaria atrata CBS 101060]|uniref:Alpha/beta-hydrolase n=1 Tax=Patellaria atrata CBS 101060 TaxID=1346257 RepID=A0A9P4SCR6_9PEZI|nr:alpha/beta-hydrolase [Patellaria atrata CBS 101060]